MPSETEIANLALSHISAKEINNLQSEKSNEAASARRFFVQARDQVLRDFPWHFATRFQVLALIEQDPTIEWTFSYAQPSDLIYARRILSGVRNDTRMSRVKFRIVQGTSSNFIFTDQEDACLEYTVKETNPERFPPDFTNALAWRLAHYMAPRVTRGDPFKLGNRALQHYVLEISRAQATAANEGQIDEIPDSEYIIEREGFAVGEGTRESFLQFFGL